MTTGKFIPLFVTVFFSLHHLKLSAQQPYNVLFIAVDDMNDKCSIFGDGEVTSPNLQRLASHGMVFTRAYAQFPLCSPSRTSVLTGWRPDKTGIKANNTRPRSILGSSVVFLPEYFRKNGYHTERYGKILHGTFENDIIWDYAEPPEKNDEKELVFNRSIIAKSDSSAIKWWVETIDDTLIDDNIIARHLVASMGQRRTQPVFYGLGFTGTHLSFSPLLKYWNMNGDPTVQQLLKTDKKGNYTNLKGNGSANIQLPNTPPGDRNDVPSIAFNSQILPAEDEWKNLIHGYNAEVTMMDAQLGIVLDEMDRHNLWKNTVVVFWSDHGQHLGEHEGCWKKNTLFEESLHVPLIVCVPGKSPGTCSRLVELVDLYPTLAELCGLPIPSAMEGTSFAPLLDNPEFDWKHAVFSQVGGDTSGGRGRSVTTEVNRYNSWNSEGEELYKHDIDPNEYNNLITNQADSGLANRLRKLLDLGWTNALPPRYVKKIWYRDLDQDGYGSFTDSVSAYWKITGFVSNQKDCDDSDASCHSGAIERCDGKDNNCDGQIDEDCLPKLSITGSRTLEGNTATKNIWFTVSLSKPSTLSVKATFVTADSTAVAGSDYVGAVKTVSFLPGEITKKIPVSIVGDATAEPDEFFKVLLTDPENATINRNKTSGEIKNDDTKPQINIQQSTDEFIASVKPGLNKNIGIWPNPARNTLNLKFQNSFDGTVKIEITDIRGSKIKEWKNSSDHSIQLDMSSFANGEYFLLITDVKGNRFTEKIIILH